MADNTVITELIIDASGAEAGSANFIRATKAAQQVADSLSDSTFRAQAAIDANGVSMVGQVNSVGSVRTAYERLQASVDPVYKAQLSAQAAIEKATLTANDAVTRGIATNTQAAAVVGAVTEKQNAHIQSIKEQTGQLTLGERAMASFGAATSGVGGQLVAMAAGAGPVGVFLAGLGPLGVVAAVGIRAAEEAMTAMLTDANQMGDWARQLQDTAAIAGLTTTQLQALDSTAEKVGVSADSINSAFSRFVVNLGQLKDGSGTLYTQLEKINPSLVAQLSVTKDNTSAWNLLAGAYANADAQQQALISRAAFGRGGAAEGRVLAATDQAGGIGGLVDQNAANAFTHQIDQWANLRKEIAAVTTEASRNISSIFTGTVLENESRFADLFLSISQAARSFSLSGDWSKFISDITGAPWQSAEQRMIVALAAGKSMSAALATAVPPMSGGGTGVSGTPFDIPVTSSNPGTFSPAGSPAAIVSGFSPSAGVFPDASAASIGVQAAQAKALVAALGLAATASEQLNAKQLELAAAFDKGSFGVKDSTAAQNDYQRALAAVDLESYIKSQQALAGVLGTVAPVQLKVSLAEAQITKARMEGVPVTQAQAAAIVANAQANALGTAAMKASADASSVQAVTLDMAVGPATAYRLEKDRLNQSYRDGQPLTQADIDAIHTQAQAAGDAATALEQMKIASQIKFGADTAFLSPQDVQIAQQLKSLYPDVAQALASPQAAAMKFNDSMKEIHDSAVKFTQDFVQGLMQGKSVMDSLGAAATNLSSTLANSAVTNLLSGNFVTGAVEGIGALVSGLFGQHQAQSDAQQQNVQAFQAMQDQLNAFIQQMSGTQQGSLTTAFAAAYQAGLPLFQAAQKAGDYAAAAQIYNAYLADQTRLIDAFNATFASTVSQFNAGLGPNSAFGTAAAAATTLGNSLMTFVADAHTAGDNVSAAADASANYALSTLQVKPALSATQTALQTLQGTAQGLQSVLVQLGMSSKDAANAISANVIWALDALKASFTTDLQSQINTAQGKGYINDIQTLITQVTGLNADAASLGLSTTQVSLYFSAAAQKIVDGAQLTGTAFNQLIQQFPQLSGLVTDFAASATAATAALQRAQGYQNSLFAAITDTSTLAGALASFDYSAQQQIQAETAAGGQAINDLESSLGAQRLAIVVKFANQAAAAEQQALTSAQNFLVTFTNNVTTYLAGLNVGTNSPLSPQQQLAAAQAAYNADLGTAQTGTGQAQQDALTQITQYATTLLGAAKAYDASSPAYQAIFSAVTSQIAALPAATDATTLIVNAVNATTTGVLAVTNGVLGVTNAIQTMHTDLLAAIGAGSAAQIATALLGNFNAIDTNLNGMISLQEFNNSLGSVTNSQLAAADALFQSIDTNGDGQLSQMEIIAAINNGTLSATNGVWTNSSTTTAQLASQNAILAATQAVVTSAATLQATTNDFLSSIQGLQTAANTQLALLQSQFSATVAVTGFNNSGVLTGTQNNILTALNKIVFNTASTAYNTGIANAYANVTGISRPYYSGVFASGGWVSGGVPGQDSVSLLAMPGEFIVNAAAAARNAGLLAALNAGSDAPSIAVPYAATNDNSSAAVLAELQALRAEVVKLRADVGTNTKVAASGHEMVAEKVDLVAQHAQTTAKAARRSA